MDITPRVRGKGPAVHSTPLTTGAVGETTEGLLVRVVATITGLAVGQTVGVTGFGSQYDTHYEIDPRFPGDIAVAHRRR